MLYVFIAHQEYLNMTTVMSETLPINSAARNAMWVYDAFVEPRFVGASVLVEAKRSYEMPDFNLLPNGADIAVELYNGAITLRLDGAQRRIYIRRFEFVSFTSDEEARHRFLTLWREVEA
ncbi:MAG: hypothetical protein WCD76_16220, partial [Pyrinomonadaceae bacterium]